MRNGTLAFCGSKGSGKSTSATVFKELFSGPTEEIAIAGHLKEVCSHVFEVDFDKFINPALKEVELETFVVLSAGNICAVLRKFFLKDINFDAHVRPHIGRVLRTPRALLQYVGTEILHPIDPLIHVKVAVKKKDPTKLTLITDLRFVAEFDYFSELADFVPVYVKNTAAENAAAADSHPSERQFFSFVNRCRFLNNEEKDIVKLRGELEKLAKEVYEQV